MTVVLRPYQQEMKQNIYASWDAGNMNVLAVLPTGGGKTQIFSDITYDGVRQGLQQALIVHRNELVSQIASTLASRGIHHRIIGSDQAISMSVNKQRKKFNKSFYNPSSQTAVIGVDTLLARQESLKSWLSQVDRYSGDEWHHCLKDNKWGKAVSLMTNARGLGVSATPTRADGKGLGRDYDGLMDDMIIGPSMRWLIQQGYLSDYDVVCPLSDMQVRDEDKAASGDWSHTYMRKAARKSRIVGDVVENYIRFALGRKAICFATDVETAGEIAAKFNEFGIRAASLNAKTPPTVREKYLEEFELGIISVLVNVDLFDEGFDVPSCEVCIMARPTGSLAKYRQMIGRVLRPMEGKVALIIDHVSNLIRHKPPDIDTLWTLARRDKRGKSVPDPEDVPLTVCLNRVCIRPYPRFMVCCPHCGTMKPLPEPRERTIDMVEGDLALMDRNVLNAMKNATILENAADVAQRVAMAAGRDAGHHAAKRQIEKITEHTKLRYAMAQWVGIQREKGFSDREIEKKFYHTVGIDVVSALNATQSRVDLEKLRTTIEGWYAVT